MDGSSERFCPAPPGAREGGLNGSSKLTDSDLLVSGEIGKAEPPAVSTGGPTKLAPHPLEGYDLGDDGAVSFLPWFLQEQQADETLTAAQGRRRRERCVCVCASVSGEPRSSARHCIAGPFV